MDTAHNVKHLEDALITINATERIDIAANPRHAAEIREKVEPAMQWLREIIADVKRDL
jgi:hypothetical protein